MPEKRVFPRLWRPSDAVEEESEYAKSERIAEAELYVVRSVRSW